MAVMRSARNWLGSNLSGPGARRLKTRRKKSSTRLERWRRRIGIGDEVVERHG
jgi:hypothetical protein